MVSLKVVFLVREALKLVEYPLKILQMVTYLFK